MKFYNLFLTDYKRYGYGKPKGLKPALFALAGLDLCVTYLFWWRMVQNLSKKNPMWPLARVILRKLSIRYSIFLSYKVKTGKGLYLGHGVGLVVNPTVVIGNNCSISQHVSIGANTTKAAVIGDNVYIGPGVCIVGNVHIGNNVTIGAGAVVVKDVPDNATVGGVPAKVLNYNNPGRFIGNRA